MNDTHGEKGRGWYGFDLDGTLAKYDGWKGIDKIGEPIHPICSLAKALHDAGHIVKIVTARIAPRPVTDTARTRYPLYAGEEIGDVPEYAARWMANMKADGHISDQIEACKFYFKREWSAEDFISDWCLEHLGFLPEIVCQKDGLMLWLFDDRSVQVEKNTGRILGDIPEEIRHLFPGMTTYRICFQDTDPDGKYSTINVKVEVRSLLSIKGVNHLINLSMRDLKYSDYDSADEYVEAIMENSGVDEWNFLSPEMDSYFELNPRSET